MGMLQPIRRVFTGHDANGRSIIVSDGPTPHQYEMPSWPGSGVTSPWATSSAPASNGDEQLAREVTAFPNPGSGGVAFMTMEPPPLSELDKMPPEQRAEATRP